MYTEIGYLGKAKGIKGEIRLYAEDFFWDYVEQLTHLPSHIFIEINGQKVPHFVENLHVQNNSEALIQFENINTRNLSKAIQSKPVFIETAKLTQKGISPQNYTNPDEPLNHLIGYTLSVIVERESEANKPATSQIIGSIESVIYLNQQELLQLTYNNTEVLIPFAEPLVEHYNETEKQICLRIAPGLLHLNN